ncbi:hypothetical protein [Tardiphaga sp. 285_C5_N1_2]|uniref:hypothetical protein n=1 Tax=Tardiphaga sp. 285_C5_N1_2 TaxID=3240775 RepID=UPI003F8A6D26
MQAIWDAIWPSLIAGAGGFIGGGLLLPTKLGELFFKSRQDRNLDLLLRLDALLKDTGDKVRRVLLSLLMLVLAGCSTTPADLDAKVAPTVQTYSENYQEIYRRVSSTAKRCLAGNVSAYASMAVDAELYPDLGYAELSVSMINWGVRNYYVTARIEKMATGSRMTVRAGNSIGQNQWLYSVIKWAGGDQDCR